MDDFYAECEEHFGELREALLQLEPSIGVGAPEPSTLEKLYHRYHALKGILGMAGFHVAESIAHRTEDYLRSMTQGQSALTEEGFDALTSAIEHLEESLAAHRQGKEPSDASALLLKLGRLVENHPGGARAPSLPPAHLEEQVRAARARGLTIWQFLFEPSPALSQKGKNINSARGRVESFGEILHSAPRIEAAGRIHFEFVVAGPAQPGDAAAWSEEGITVRPYQARSQGMPAHELPQVQRAESAAAPATVMPSHVRVDLTRLDELMRIMGDMVLHRARLEDLSSRISGFLPTADARALQEVQAAFGRELRNLRDGLMRVRLVSIVEIFHWLPFAVRDLSRESGVRVRLAVTGQDTKIDKYLVERLKDPLLHLVRNAVCHGIEGSEERIARAKPAEATISLRAATQGESVVIEVTDDGRGIDEGEVVQRARAQGLQVADHPDPAQLLELICHSGLSTRDEADRGAGRGVGMSAVKHTLSELGGQLSLWTEAGRGTTFTLRLPLTLAIADALIISAGGQRFAIPQGAVQEITAAQSAAIQGLERNEIMTYRNGVLPLIRLSTIFQLRAEPLPEFPVLVLGLGSGAVGVAADRLLGLREIVVRPVNDPLLKVPAIAGATELGDGCAVLIIDAPGLVETARRQKTQRAGGMRIEPESMKASYG